MHLKDYMRPLSKDERQKLAEQAETTVEYLIQLAGGHRIPSLRLAERIEIASSGKVDRYSWRISA